MDKPYKSIEQRTMEGGDWESWPGPCDQNLEGAVDVAEDS